MAMLVYQRVNPPISFGHCRIMAATTSCAACWGRSTPPGLFAQGGMTFFRHGGSLGIPNSWLVMEHPQQKWVWINTYTYHF
jgi:hypothetical protein